MGRVRTAYLVRGAVFWLDNRLHHDGMFRQKGREKKQGIPMSAIRKVLPYLSFLVCIGIASIFAFSSEPYSEVIRTYDMDDTLLNEKTVHHWELPEQILFIVTMGGFGMYVFVFVKGIVEYGASP